MTKKQPKKTTKPAEILVPALFDPITARSELMDYCTTAGLIWAEGNWQYIVPIIQAQKLTQEQAIAAVKAHITLVAHLFNPKAYNWRSRFILAGHFLFNFKRN